jgi:hypothetical protein
VGPGDASRSVDSERPVNAPTYARYSLGNTAT